MRLKILDRPNTYKRLDSDPSDPYHPAPGTQAVSNYREGGADVIKNPMLNDLTNEETFYKNIPDNLAGQLVTNSKEAGTFGNTPEFMEALEHDRKVHMPLEQKDSILRQNALRARLGMPSVGSQSAPPVPQDGGSAMISGSTSVAGQSELPKMNDPKPITGTESAPATIGDNIPRWAMVDYDERSKPGGLNAATDLTGIPSQEFTDMKNAINKSRYQNRKPPQGQEVLTNFAKNIF